MRASRKRWSGRWSRRAGAALVLASTTLCVSAPLAAGSNSDEQATHAYLTAEYNLSRALLHKAAAVRSAESAAATRIARECRGVLSGMPQPSLTPLASLTTPRAKGENARLTHQQQTIEAELAATITKPGVSMYRPAREAYAAEVRQLSWSNPAIAARIQAATATELEDVTVPAPPFCADARAWVQSGYRALSADSREFKASREARKSTVREGLPLDALLKPYENASDRALIRKTRAVESKLFAGVDAAIQTDLRLRRILGFPHAETEEPKKRIVLGRGRTAAGTRFEVSSGTAGGLFDSANSCHGSATVAYTRPGEPEVLIVGGPNNPICLSRPAERHPALFCEEGIETIQTAVPASVRSVRLVLADGRAIESRVVHVPRKNGGPAGIYAQEIRGSSSHAVSLVELNAGDEIVLALPLPRYRCVKPRHQQELLATVELATGHTPQGEPFTIRAFGEFNGEPFLSVDAGVNPELNELTIEELQSPKAFPWSLSIGCAPHPYAILYGILAPPGTSVTAQTPQGAVVLNVVPIEPRIHAKGPLVYGAFSTLPSELVVRRGDGSTVYTESLLAKDKEAAEFCEGYVEG
jgi:hypothetical protein